MAKNKSEYFRKYNHRDGYISVFNNILNKYSIDINGVLIDNGTNNVIPHLVYPNGERYVLIRLASYGNILREYKISHLVLHTFKPTNLSIDYYWGLDVLYKDGDFNNLHPTNLVWHWTKLMCLQYPGYAIIPGASSYCINLDGSIINLKNNKKVNIYISDGYRCASIYPDVGKIFKARVHRLKCLAWLDYPADIDELEVNHIDGIKDNNDISNLEIVTSTRNNNHAYEIGLFKDKCNSVLVRFYSIDIKTRKMSFEEKQFSSLAECGRYFKVDEVTIGRRLRFDPFLLYVDLNDDKTTLDYLRGVQFKLNNDTPWVNPDPYDNPYLNSQISEPVKYRDIITGEVYLSKSSKQLAETLGVNYGSVCHILQGKLTRPVKQYEIKYYTDNTNWSKFTDDQIEIYKLMLSNNKFITLGNGYKCIDIVTNEFRLFTNIHDVLIFLNIKLGYLSKLVTKGGILDNKWLIKSIPLYGSRT